MTCRTLTLIIGLFLLGAPLQAQIPIFDDSIDPNWYDDSWNVGTIYNTVFPAPYSGNSSVHTIYTASYGALMFTRTAPIVPSGVNTLTFAFRYFHTNDNVSFGGNLHALLYGPGYNPLGTANFASYIPSGIISNRWYQVSIPLSDLNGQGVSIQSIAFQSQSLEQIHYDAVRLEHQNPLDPGIVFDDTFRTENFQNFSWNVTQATVSSPRVTGSSALANTVTQDWGGVGAYNLFNTTGYRSFELYFRTNSSNQDYYFLILDGSNQTRGVFLREYVSGATVTPNTWYHIIVPLSDLGVQASSIYQVSVQSGTANVTFYVDEFKIGYNSSTSKWTPPTPSTSPFAFDEAIGAGWSDCSWSGATTVTSVAAEGSSGYQMTTTAEWGGLYLCSSGFDTTTYKTLRFFIHGSSSGGQEMYVALVDDQGEEIAYKSLAPYIAGGSPQANSYAEVIMPLSYLSGEDRLITGIVFQPHFPTTFYVDEVLLSAVDGNTEQGPPPTTVSHMIFDDALGEGWSESPIGAATDHNSLQCYSGDRGIRASFQSSWSGEYFSCAGFDTSGYSHLNFAFFGDVNSLYVAAFDQNGNELTAYQTIGQFDGHDSSRTDIWHVLSIPLSYLGVASRVLGGIGIQSANAQEGILDFICFGSQSIPPDTVFSQDFIEGSLTSYNDWYNSFGSLGVGSLRGRHTGTDFDHATISESYGLSIVAPASGTVRAIDFDCGSFPTEWISRGAQCGDPNNVGRSITLEFVASPGRFFLLGDGQLVNRVFFLVAHTAEPNQSTPYPGAPYSSLLDIQVDVGDTIQQGAPLGQIGNARGLYGSHLHASMSYHPNIIDASDLRDQGSLYSWNLTALTDLVEFIANNKDQNYANPENIKPGASINVHVYGDSVPFTPLNPSFLLDEQIPPTEGGSFTLGNWERLGYDYDPVLQLGYNGEIYSKEASLPGSGRWTPRIPRTGFYDIQVHIPDTLDSTQHGGQNSFSYVSNAIYTVDVPGVSVQNGSIAINQQQHRVQFDNDLGDSRLNQRWVSLGRFFLYSDRINSVLLNGHIPNEPGRKVVVDAMRFIYHGSSE